jgi:transcriptional regulator with XRE-family HTH domain
MSAQAEQLQPVGELLRTWREWRRFSQLELASRAEVSSRHLSFVENGRSMPSRDMVIRLADHLDIPLRDRNRLLISAGFAPVFPERGMEAPQLAGVRDIVRRVLDGHEPYPAAVVDAHWNLVDANKSLHIFTDVADPSLLDEPVNVMRLALHPLGLAPHMVNLGEWRAHALGRMGRRIALTADPQLIALRDELRTYPCDQPQPEAVLPGPGDIAVPLRLRRDGVEFSFLCTVATFGTALDVTVAELSIETFFPADADSAALLREGVAAHSTV